ncbi:MAG: DUF4325 domain-containing protein [Patescibacteria group bacterium]|jgi:hypothetical protein
MNIELKKFGTTLTSRDGGKEAYNALQSSLINFKEDEELVVDFKGVDTFSPSWGDEFLANLFNKYKNRLVLINTTNPSVIATLEMLSDIKDIKFNLQ